MTGILLEGVGGSVCPLVAAAELGIMSATVTAMLLLLLLIAAKGSSFSLESLARDVAALPRVSVADVPDRRSRSTGNCAAPKRSG